MRATTNLTALLIGLTITGCATPESGQSTQVPAPVVYVTNNFGNGHTVSTDEHTNAQSPGISNETKQDADAKVDAKADIKVPAPGAPPIPVAPK